MHKKNINTKNLNNLNDKTAFTLAEVLITLAIIGVVAAITIPSLNYKINKQDTVAKIKKAYSILSQATQNINNDCGGSIANCVTDPNAADNDDTTRREVAALYKTKLQVIKDCTGTTKGCFADSIYKYLNNTDYINYETVNFCSHSRLLLNDGIAVCFDWGGPASGSLYSIHLDINGPQLPNQLGKDVFSFNYNQDYDVLKAYSGTSCTITGTGSSCAAKILIDGEINYY